MYTVPQNGLDARAKCSPRPGEPFNPWRGACGFYPPDLVSRQKTLTDGQKLLYARLVRYAGKDGSCFPSFRRLAEDLGKSERQVKRDMLALEQERLIGHVRRGRRLANVYEFLWHAIFEGEVTSMTPHSRSEGTPTALQESHGEVPGLAGEVTSTARGEVTSTSPESGTEETRTEESSRETVPVAEQAPVPEQKTRPDQTSQGNNRKTASREGAEREAVKRAIEAFGLGEPDDALIDATLKGGQGATGFQIGSYLYDRLKFVQRNPQHAPNSMGWFPKIVTERFRSGDFLERVHPLQVLAAATPPAARRPDAARGSPATRPAA
ncbi:MAG: helix-turn-helix domain-containing protein [Bryobacteraceae bacterium]